MVDTHPAGVTTATGEGMQVAVAAWCADRKSMSGTTCSPWSVEWDITVGTVGARRTAAGCTRLVRVSTRRAAADSHYFRACAPPGAGPANSADHRTLLRYPAAHNPATAVIASQPGVHHQGAEQRKRVRSLVATSGEGPCWRGAGGVVGSQWLSSSVSVACSTPARALDRQGAASESSAKL
jgi:hypothetical protein